MGKLIQMLPGKDAIAEANEFFLRAVEIARDDPHAAILLYKEAIQRCRAKMDNAFLNLGTLYFEMRDFEKAEEYYKEALEVNPDNAPAHFNLGNICDEWGQHQEAAKFYAQAIQLDPSYADAHYNFALLCEHVNLQMEAIKHWRAYIKLDPSSLWPFKCQNT